MVLVVICYVKTALDPSQYSPGVSSRAQWYNNPTPKFPEKLEWIVACVPNS